MYLIDSNVLIEAKNRHYGFDIVPGFWEWMVGAHSRGRLHSVAKVAVELKGHQDQLSSWASVTCPSSFFLPVDNGTLQSVATLITWAAGNGYTSAAQAEFAGSADLYLIAHAHAHQRTVVTHEKPSETTKRVKIPDACRALGVGYVDTFQMLRAEAASFVLP